jgi:hypothetical protein
MRLSRETCLLIGVPAVLIGAGAWWIASSSQSASDAATTRFQLADATRPPTRSPLPVAAITDERETGRAVEGPPSEILATPAVERPDADAMLWSGVVRSRDGLAIPGATVRVRRARGVRLGDDSLLYGGEWTTLEAGADGMVAFQYAIGQEFEIEAWAPGFGVERFALQGQVGQDLVLDRASAVDGRLLMAGTGAPVAGATVRYENAFERREATTDAEGRFRFAEVGARAARVQFSDGSFVARARGLTAVAPGATMALGDILVDAGSVLAGEVIDPVFGAVPGAYVTLVDRVSREEVASAVADSAGRFSFQALDPRRQYALIASGPGYRADSLAGDQGFVSMHVSTTWDLAIALSSAGASVAGALASLRRQDGLPFAGNQTSIGASFNRNGVVVFSGLSRDVAYRVVVAHPGSATVDLGPLTAGWNEGRQLVVGLVAGSTVSGTVLNASGEPLGGVVVRAQRADAFPAPPLFVTADGLGRFSFDAMVAPGSVSLVTFKPGYDNTRDVVAVPQGGVSVTLAVRPLSVLVDVQ